MLNLITDDQWRFYEENGYLNLGKVLNEADLTALQSRIDAIMLGDADLDYDKLLMQLDSQTGKYEDAGVQSKGWKGKTLAYRKIQNLEADALFDAFIKRPIFREICARVYEPETPIACYRAMFMNKPARAGTLLPWHQDRWTNLDRDPLLTVWAALDPATKANGCVEVVPGSHKKGLINPSHPSAFVTDTQAAEFAPPGSGVFLELAPGEVAILHNWLLHRSDTNATDVSRRAFSVCYMDARTRASGGGQFTPVFAEAMAGVA